MTNEQAEVATNESSGGSPSGVTEPLTADAADGVGIGGGTEGGTSESVGDSSAAVSVPSAPVPDDPGTGDRSPGLIKLEEVAALLRYASDKGIDPDGRVTGPLHDLVARGIAGPLTDEDKRNIFLLYTQLNNLTPAEITGATLIDSSQADVSIRAVRILTWYVVFPLIVLNGVTEAWLGDAPEPEEGALLVLVNLQRYVLGFITPFLWGALGSCVYLLKRYSDLAEDRVFSAGSLQGWGTRITLGAILGGVVQFIYDSSAFTSAGLQLDANAMGFLAGIGVKVVYGALEKTIEALGSAMNLDALRKAKTEKSEIRSFINQEIAKLGDTEEDQAKRKVLAAVLANLNG